MTSEVKQNEELKIITEETNQVHSALSYGFVIPNYNHHNVIEATISNLIKFQMPIILVDDGSQLETQLILNKIDEKYPTVTLIKRPKNGGKGAAVKTGLREAIDKGWSHALQIDADGQHDLNDVKKLLSLSKATPLALISGSPSYDESISKGRYYGRFITHFWVYLETLSLSIKDSMCGFRVYPLNSYQQLVSKSNLGDKMDFDIEVMVKMYWLGVPMQFLPTKVHYPEDGLSHFNLFEDNLLITLMHTRLFFGMLLRIPKLLYFKVRNNKSNQSNSEKKESSSK